MTPGGALSHLDAARARAIAGRFTDSRLVVIGDVMLDRFQIGRVTRISPEAPVPVVLFDRDEVKLGGAANVAQNIAALGGHVTLVGAVGDDPDGLALRSALSAAGIDTSGILIDPSRRTTTKLRIVTTRHQQVARVDYEADHDVSGAVEEAIVSAVSAHAPSARAIVVSDYQKGLVTRGTMTRVAAVARTYGLPLLVDPKVPHMDFYTGATLVTPNQHEAEQAAHARIRTREDARHAAQLLRDRLQVEGILITLGEQGLWLNCGAVDGSLAASAREVADVTGAGDTVIATLALAMAAGATPAEAACLANEAAGVAVGKFGAASVTREELLARFH
jgi:D-beta-D-heptose 7-phosphate kinase/D-beta-D-heptose 1-phosphate adenosyltransferase